MLWVDVAAGRCSGLVVGEPVVISLSVRKLACENKGMYEVWLVDPIEELDRAS